VVRLTPQPSDPSDNTLKALSIRQFQNLPTSSPFISKTIAEFSIKRPFLEVERFDICPGLGTKAPLGVLQATYLKGFLIRDLRFLNLRFANLRTGPATPTIIL